MTKRLVAVIRREPTCRRCRKARAAVRTPGHPPLCIPCHDEYIRHGAASIDFVTNERARAWLADEIALADGKD